jgi:hypothetical protein
MIAPRHQGLQWMDESDWRKDRVVGPSPKRQKIGGKHQLETYRVGYKGMRVEMMNPNTCNNNTDPILTH